MEPCLKPSPSQTGSPYPFFLIAKFCMLTVSTLWSLIHYDFLYRVIVLSSIAFLCCHSCRKIYICFYIKCYVENTYVISSMVQMLIFCLLIGELIWVLGYSVDMFLNWLYMHSFCMQFSLQLLVLIVFPVAVFFYEEAICIWCVNLIRWLCMISRTPWRYH